MHRGAMRTTLDLPESLIAEAMKLSQKRTKTAVIIAALEDYIRKNRIKEIKKYKGQIDLDTDLDALRKRH